MNGRSEILVCSIDLKAMAAIIINGSSRKKKLVEDVEYLLPVKLRQNLFSIYRGEIVNLSVNQRQRCHLCWCVGTLCRECWVGNCFITRFVKIYLAIAELKFVTANQTPGRQSYLVYRSEKHKDCRGRFRWAKSATLGKNHQSQLSWITRVASQYFEYFEFCFKVYNSY